jgi:hypothetical protein
LEIEQTEEAIHNTATTTKEKTEKMEKKKKKIKKKNNNNEDNPADWEWTQVTLSQIIHEIYQCSPLLVASY